MKKTMSCFLLLCLVTVATNVAFASNSVKGKIFAVKKSDVSKIEVINAGVKVLAYENYQVTDNFVATIVIKALSEESTNVNAIVPESTRIRDRRFSHSTAYLLNIPKNYLLPRNHTWRYGTSMRC